MKRILFLILGYYLVIQAALALFATEGNRLEYGAIILPIALLSGGGGYYLIIMGRLMGEYEKAMRAFSVR